MTEAKPSRIIPRWGRFEQQFASTGEYINPVQEAALKVDFVAPSGHTYPVDGFWDGGHVWRVRFAPNESGIWQYETRCENDADQGLHHQSGQFECVAPLGSTPFEQHGPLRVSDNGRYLTHADGTPFLWLADTAWNGPLNATDGEWEEYLRERTRQRFSAVQWVATQWLAAPDGDEHGALAFTGKEQITINPAFFRRLDGRLTAINAAGLLAAPVLLWAAEWRSKEINESNPGLVLLEDQAILLARYMLARWGAHHVLWILPGDGHYDGAQAERWRRIGRALFDGRPHLPVVLHPSGMRLFLEEFQNESWLDIIGYQSGHGDDAATLAWLTEGPPATQWKSAPPRPFINLEPPYENHIAYQSGNRHRDLSVRRALYWSLLIAPTAGVTYGGHGVWGWDDGSKPPMNHPGTGVPLHWRDALRMLGAEQIAHLAAIFTRIAWWTLRPAPELLKDQPGKKQQHRFIAASRSETGDLAVIYIPEDRQITVRLDVHKANLPALWFNPRSGEQIGITLNTSDNVMLTTPASGDWLLVIGYT